MTTLGVVNFGPFLAGLGCTHKAPLRKKISSWQNCLTFHLTMSGPWRKRVTLEEEADV